MRKLRYAMVGGGQGAFIGAVHRKAMALDGQMELVAGAVSSDPERARASGRDLGLRDERNHGRWEDLLADELRRGEDERIDFVSVVTPNHMHFPVARAFAEAGIHRVVLTVTPDNVAATRLYERLGFHVEAEEAHYFGPGERRWRMARGA